MISQVTQLKTEVNGKEQKYHCEPNCSLQEVLDGINTFRSYVVGRIKEVEDQKESEKQKVENV